VIRLLFTKEHVPFEARRAWLRPVGLDFASPLWRSTDLEGWWLSEDRWPFRDRRRLVTLAAKRGDVAEDPAEGVSGESNWYLTQRFARYHASLAARYAIPALLALYANRLSDLRDKAGVKRFPRRPVGEAQALDEYLIRDGLDAATIASDLELLTRDLTEFRWGVAEFTEHLERSPTAVAHSREAIEYVPSLCARIREQAERLASDTATTTGNIKASAELRQAIANTMLQRLIVVLSLAAIVIAIVSLLIARH
jgi:hypothetical protein